MKLFLLASNKSSKIDILCPRIFEARLLKCSRSQAYHLFKNSYFLSFKGVPGQNSQQCLKARQPKESWPASTTQV